MYSTVQYSTVNVHTSEYSECTVGYVYWETVWNFEARLRHLSVFRGHKSGYKEQPRENSGTTHDGATMLTCQTFTLNSASHLKS